MVGWKNGDQDALTSVHKILTAANFPFPTSLLLPAQIAHKGIRSHGIIRKPSHLHACLLTIYASWPVNTSAMGLSVQ